MLPVIGAAAFWIESYSKCAYRAVLYTCVWPSNFPPIVKLSPAWSTRCSCAY